MNINNCKKAVIGSALLLFTAVYFSAAGISRDKSTEPADVQGNNSSALITRYLMTAVSAVTGNTAGAYIAITDESFPADEIPTESSFSVRGGVYSNIKLKKVWGGVYNTDGTPTDVYCEDEPDASFYDLSSVFDEKLDTSELPAGSYIYRIEASDEKNHSQVLVEKSFSIIYDESAASDIQIYNASYPTGSLVQGRSVGIRGSVVSSHTITSVSGGIYKAEGSESSYENEFTFTSDGGRKKLDLAQFGDSIAVGSLPAGEYIYRLTATDKKGYTKELINSPFRIISPDLTQNIMRGIDVRGHDEDIQWTKLCEDGINFAMICAGTDSGGDPSYRPGTELMLDYDSARNTDLKVGFSFYTSAVNKSLMKAGIDGLIKKLNGKKASMPVYINAEANVRSALSAETMTELLVYGCEQLTESGYKAGIYSSYEWFRDNIDMKLLGDSDCDIWLAFNTSGQGCVSWLYSNECTDEWIAEKPDAEAEEGTAEEPDEETFIDFDDEHLNALIPPESYSVTLAQPEDGKIQSDKERASGGERVTISAGSDRKHTVKSVKYNGSEASRNADGTYSFTMPYTDTEITVELVECDPAGNATDFGAVSEMPVPFGTAGTSAFYYDTPCGEQLAVLPDALMKMTYDGYSWEYTYAADKPVWSVTLMDHPNIYSFIHTHYLDPDKVRQVLSDGDKMIHHKAFSDEEIDLLLGDDEAKVMEHFASDSTIVVGEKGYGAKWMYYHSADEYKEAGITPEMVREAMPYYYDPLYVQEAADAFSQKLFSYTGVLTETKCKQWLAGDINSDGDISGEDAELLKKYLDNEVRLSFTQWASADMNGDQQTDEDDLALLESRPEGDFESEKAVLLDVMEFSQFPDYPTGCESVALYMLLDYYDVGVTVDSIFDLLPRGTQPHLDKKGIRRGADPEKQFVGDPRTTYSYGVFNAPIAEVANKLRPGAKTKTNATLEYIRAILDTGAPVMAWYVSAPVRDIVYRWSWLDDQGKTIYWPGGEHAVIICGYDDDTITYRDPNAGTTVIIENELFLKSFNELGGRIVYYADDEEIMAAVNAAAEAAAVTTAPTALTTAYTAASTAMKSGAASGTESTVPDNEKYEAEHYERKNYPAAVLALILAVSGSAAAIASVVLRRKRGNK